MELKRVVVTGIGAISGLGHTVDENWSALMSGKSGVSTIESVDTEKCAVKIAGEVKKFTIDEELLSAKDQDRFDKFNHFALHSASEAIKDSDLLNSNYDKNDIGMILGVGMGGFPDIERTHSAMLERGARRVSPFFIPSVIPNMTTGLISLHYGFTGVNYTISSACASGAHALINASTEIQLGRQKVMISGGAESVLCHLPLHGFANMRALSKRNEDPEKASRPYDEDRDGFVMGEGAGILVLEEYESAKARGAKIYAEVVGFGYSSDAHHITAPHPEGVGAISCMEMAIKTAGIKPSQIDYINTHGTSTPLGDIGETKAIKAVFKDHAEKLNISSTKSMTGHLLGAAAGVEAVYCCKAIKEGKIPPTINIENQDPECDLNYTPNKPVDREINFALSNSFGFGGTNGCLIFKKV